MESKGKEKAIELAGMIAGAVVKGIRGENSTADFEAAMRDNERRLDEITSKDYSNSPSRGGGHVKSILGLGAGIPKGSNMNSVSDTTDIVTEDPFYLRVKDPTERYSSMRFKGRHLRTGEPVIGSDGAEVELPSQAEKAKLGVWFKFLASKKFADIKLTEHETDILNEMFARDAWVEDSPSKATYRKGPHVKAAILDSATSGGSYTNPLFFDEYLVRLPLLGGEVAPYCTYVDVPRGSVVNGASVGNPTLTWGTAEGSALTLFDATSLISQITSTIYPVQVGVEVGRDIMADSLPADGLGQTLVDNIMQRIAQEMDAVVTAGSGSSRPTGITQASGTNNVTFATATTGPYTIGDLLEMMFAVQKVYQGGPGFTGGPRTRFMMTWTTYGLFRSMATGVTGDTRLVLGESIRDFNILGAPVSIENSGLSNDIIIYGDLSRFRIWRRSGAEVRWTDEGVTLRKSNTMLLTVRMRVAGKVTDANGFAVATSGIP